jgi:glycine betaine/proline transport system permease protein
MLLPNDLPRIPLEEWVNIFIQWLTGHFGWLFDAINVTFGALIRGTEYVFLHLPVWVVFLSVICLTIIASGIRLALFAALGLLLLLNIDLWSLTMQTLSLVLAASVVSVFIGVPLGIIAAESQPVESALAPVLDIMQTMPAYVYLIPMVVLLGLGNVPALIATVIFAMPPAIRLTVHGIRQVPRETLEAAEAFGATRLQTLLRVKLPLAYPSILVGINQVIMLALSMVVIAALIGAGGLGQQVIYGLSQLDVGKGFSAGVGIIVLAILLDRITRGIATKYAS